jgi:hypothetical protein
MRGTRVGPERFLAVGNKAEANMSTRSKRFVLPYEPEYTAHRDDERACRVTQLHRKAREQAGPAIVPELDEMDGRDVDRNLPHVRPRMKG